MEKSKTKKAQHKVAKLDTNSPSVFRPMELAQFSSSSCNQLQRTVKTFPKKSRKQKRREKRQQRAQPKPKPQTPLTSGIVTQALSTCGYLFSKDYGAVYIPLRAVQRPSPTVDDMNLYLKVGESVKFRVRPQASKNNCQWVATHVEVSSETDIQPDVLRDKTGVVIKIADNGTYAFIKSEEHGTVFCPGSACVSQGEGKRLDEVFQVGDKVKFTAHVQLEKTGGVGWLAVTAAKLGYSARTAWHEQNCERNESITGWARKRPWQSQEAESTDVSKTAFPQSWPSLDHSSNATQQQPTPLFSETTQSVHAQGTVLNVSSGCAVVAAVYLGHVMCPLSSWTSSSVRHQQTTSLLDVLAIGDLVQIRATRDAPWQAWRAVVLCKQHMHCN